MKRLLDGMSITASALVFDDTQRGASFAQFYPAIPDDIAALPKSDSPPAATR